MLRYAVAVLIMQHLAKSKLYIDPEEEVIRMNIRKGQKIAYLDEGLPAFAAMDPYPVNVDLRIIVLRMKCLVSMFSFQTSG